MYNINNLVKRMNGSMDVTRALRLVLDAPYPTGWAPYHATTTNIAGMTVADVDIVYFHAVAERLATRDLEVLEDSLATIYFASHEWRLDESEYDVDIYDMSFEYSIVESYLAHLRKDQFASKTLNHRYPDQLSSIFTSGMFVSDMVIAATGDWCGEDISRNLRCFFNKDMTLKHITWGNNPDNDENWMSGKEVLKYMQSERLYGTNPDLEALRIGLYGVEDNNESGE